MGCQQSAGERLDSRLGQASSIHRTLWGGVLDVVAKGLRRRQRGGAEIRGGGVLGRHRASSVGATGAVVAAAEEFGSFGSKRVWVVKVVEKKRSARARVRWVVWNSRLQIAGGASLLTAGLGILNLVDPFVWASAVLGAMAIITTREHNRRLFLQLTEERAATNEIVLANGNFHVAVMKSMAQLTNSAQAMEQLAVAAAAVQAAAAQKLESSKGTIQ